MKKLHLLLSGIVIFLAGCTEKIDIELYETYSRIVIEGSITNRQLMHTIKLSKSSSYFSNEKAEMISGAEVSISESYSNGELRGIHQLIEYEPGIYKTDKNVMGFPGLFYTLTVNIVGKQYAATSEMRPVTRIDSIHFFTDEENPRIFLIALYAREPSTPGDYYMWSVYKNYQLVTNTITELIFKNDELINGKYISGIIVQTVKGSMGTLVTLKMSSITKEYFNYNIALLKEAIYNEGPFEAAPANIKGNISNGALGFFSAQSETFYTRKIGIKEK